MDHAPDDGSPSGPTPSRADRTRAEDARADHDTLARIGLALTSELDLERLVQRLTDEATQAVGAQFGAFFYNAVSARGESYTLYTISGVPPEAFSRFPMPRNTAVFAPTFRGEGVVRSDDIRADPRYGKSGPHHGMPEGHLPVVSYLAAPVVTRDGEVIGGLFFGHGERARFAERDERVLTGIATHAAIAFENARLVQQLREQDRLHARRAREAAVAAEIGALLASATGAPATEQLGRCAAALARYPDVGLAQIWLGERAHLVLRGSSVTVAQPAPTVALGEGTLGQVARDRVPAVMSVTDDEASLPALAALPLVVGADLVGVLEVRGAEPFRADTIDGLKPITDLLAIGIQRGVGAEKLRTSEIKHRLVALASAEGIWSWDIRANTVEWNDRLLELMGVQRDGWGGTFADWFERVHPDDQPAMRDALEAHLAGRGAYDIPRFRLRHASGEYRVCRTRGQAEHDAHGAPVRMAGSFSDVTEQVRAQEALAASELRYRQMLDSVRDMVFCKAHGSVVVYANKATCEHYGMSAEELTGVTDAPHAERDLSQKYLRDDREVLEHGRVVEDPEEPNARHDGSLRYFHVVKTPIRDARGEIVEMVGVARDVTERKQRDDDERFLAEASTVLASSIDYETTLANVAALAVPRFADWFAIDELEGDGTIRRITVHHHDPAKIALAYELDRKYPTPRDAPMGVPAVLRTGLPEVVAEIPDELLERSAHSPEHLAIARSLGLRSYMILPLIAHGKVLGAVSLVAAESGRLYDARAVELAQQLAGRVATAIENAKLFQETQRALAERDGALQALQALNGELERRVEERTADLADALRELESFSYTVSHDLRAPIRHISGFVDLLTAHTGDTLDDKGRRWLRTIGGASQQMGVLIDALLAFSRLGRADLTRTRVDLGDVLRAVLADAEPDLAGREVAWAIAELPAVRGDSTMIRVVLTNLVSNAIKYSRGRARAHVEIGWREESDQAVVWVKDDGAGFDMQYANKLFGVFQRLHHDSSFEGTGIGLATVRRIVQRHGGRTWAESVPGEGATFFITLPLADRRSR